MYGGEWRLWQAVAVPVPPPPAAPSTLQERLAWARSVTSTYDGPASVPPGAPLASELPALAEVLEQATRNGTPEQIALALPLADVLGAAWERSGEHHEGLTRLDGVLAAATRAGLQNELGVARALRRRARLAMAGRLHDEAEEDLARAYALAAPNDERLTLSVLLDRADLAMHRGDWAQASQVVPELLRRTEITGDPLLQAMGLNRAGWCAFGQGEQALALSWYERAQLLAGLHEDLMVEARTACGLALLAMLRGDHEGSRLRWRRALALAEQVHDRAFTLTCLDGIAALLALQGRDGATQLAASVTALRQTLGRPREPGLHALHDLVIRHGAGEGQPWSYAEAVTSSRRAVSDPL